MVAKWDDENDVQELDHLEGIFDQFSKPQAKLEIAEKEEAKEELTQSTVLFCADVIKMEEKVVKSKKKKSNIVPESQLPCDLEASQDKDVHEIFV